jgi:hypothetical protein
MMPGAPENPAQDENEFSGSSSQADGDGYLPQLKL